MFRLQTLGGLGLEGGVEALGGAATQRRPLALLALIAVNPSLSRDKAMTLLWPESDQVSARNRLKQTIYALRRDLSCPDLIIGNAELRLNPEVIVADVWEFDAAIKARRPSAALELYRGPFLDGVFVAESPEFERWAEDQRAAIAHRFATAAKEAVAEAMASGDFGRAVSVSRRMATLDPLNTAVALSVVSALAASGDRAGAIQYGRGHSALLKEELEVDGDPDMDRLIESIRAESVGTARTSPPRTSPPIVIPSPALVIPSAARDLLLVGPKSPVRRRVAIAVGISVLVLSVAGSLWYRSARAWTAFRLGRASEAVWDVENARSHFKAAIAADTTFGEAYLALAELASWKPIDPGARDEQRWSARLALQFGERLTPDDRTRAAALSAAADERWAEACTLFDKLIAADSMSYSAWFGRAECLLKDATVIADSSSPSGWRFRTSFQEASRSYIRAFAVRPDFHRAFGGQAIATLSRVLFLQPNRARRGFNQSKTPTQFVAFPAWDSDSLAFVPYSMQDVQRRRPGATPTTTLDAVAHNKETLRRLTASWVASAPESADAFEAHASVLELLGETDVARGGTTAVWALAVARRLSTVPEQQLRLAITDVRFRLKQQRFKEAATLADSLLDAWPDPTTSVAQWLAPLAALRGRDNLAARLQRIAAPLAPPPTQGRTWSDLPAPVTTEWVTLTTFAALGGPPDSIDAAYNRLDVVARLIEPASRTAARAALFQEPARFQPNRMPDSVWRILDTLGDPISHMAWAARKKDERAVRLRFASLEAARSHFRLADRWPDAVLLESQSLLAVGDTLPAIGMIDPYLAALPVLNPSVLDRVQTAASLRRLIALRAAIARARGEDVAMKKWSSAARELASRP